jgi:hypothetical protein
VCDVRLLYILLHYIRERACFQAISWERVTNTEIYYKIVAPFYGLQGKVTLKSRVCAIVKNGWVKRGLFTSCLLLTSGPAFLNGLTLLTGSNFFSPFPWSWMNYLFYTIQTIFSRTLRDDDVVIHRPRQEHEAKEQDSVVKKTV